MTDAERKLVTAARRAFGRFVDALGRRDTYRFALEDRDHPVSAERRELLAVRLDRVEHELADYVAQLDAYERKLRQAEAERAA